MVTIATNALLIGLLYKVLPKRRIRWRHAMGGGLIVSLVWILGQRLLVRFLIGPGYTAYGVVGSFIAVMIWVYYVTLLSFSARSWWRPSPRKKKPDGPANAHG